MNMSDDHSAKQIKALGTAQQAIFDAFGQPAMEHKVKHDDPIDDDAHAGKSRQELLAYVTNLEWTVRSRDESIQEYITILGDD